MVNGIENTSRSRRQRPLPDDLPEPTRVLLRELRALKERAGLDLRALEQATHASRSSWGRWLAGDTWIPLGAVEGLARLCREDESRFRELWEAAEQARRTAGLPEAGDRIREAAAEISEEAAAETGGPEGTGNRDGDGERSGNRGEAGEEAEGSGKPGDGEEHDGGENGNGGDSEDGGRPGDGVEAGRPAPRRLTSRLRRRFLIGTALGLSVGVAAGVVLGGSALESRAGDGAGPTTPVLAGVTGGATGGATGTARPAVARATMIERARSWHPATARRVPYSQFKVYGGYRTDGSGYVSMTLGLPKPGPNTISLASSAFSRRIEMAELLQGDLVIDPVGGNTARAVVIFDRWADSARTSYWAYQQRSGYGTDHRVVEHGLRPGDQFRAHRPVNLGDEVPILKSPAPD
ncbi:helix-turn-helix transcriptional regulator [Streptosporangium sp. NPDC048865]|uniref:helix-turn-helix domain-containing protein n=1 Tax=Streptosporangium sp. NPDC048865 TaxID=3155766 RepID=UPI00343B7372